MFPLQQMFGYIQDKYDLKKLNKKISCKHCTQYEL